jgi:putative redox protein
MIQIDVSYDGQLRCTATHEPSRTALTTDAPKDNHGRGESFSPTDLLATALGTCMATMMGIQSRKESWDLTGLRVVVQKEMTQTPPRKVARLVTHLTIPAETAAKLNAQARAALQHTAETCPVRLSIADSIDVPLTFDWQG